MSEGLQFYLVMTVCTEEIGLCVKRNLLVIRAVDKRSI